MSATILYAVNEDGIVQPHSEFKNSWGSAMLVWDFLAQKYFPKPADHDPTDTWSYCTLNMDYLKKVWALENREDLPLCEYAALLSTFDGAMCRREYLPRLSELFIEFDTHVRSTWPDRTVNSMFKQAVAFVKVASTGVWQAVCWQQTTCGPEQWRDKDGIEGPYNINVGKIHWFMDELLQEREAKVVA